MVHQFVDPFGAETALQLLRRNDPAIDEPFLLRLLSDPQCSPAICHAIAQNRRFTKMYEVCRRLVAHRATPQSEAAKLVYYLYWSDLLRLSTEMQVPASSRRLIDKQLLLRVGKLSVGERIAAAKRCGTVLIKVFLFDPDSRVFVALLKNQRLREEDLLLFVSSRKAEPEHLNLIALDAKWSVRRGIRKALALNPVTPRATAASQLRYLGSRDLRDLLDSPETSVYLRRCIERLHPEVPALDSADFPTELTGID